MNNPNESIQGNEPLTQHRGVAALLKKDNVDTDIMMPKQYLKCINKYGYGDWLFDEWRYLDKGEVETEIASREINPDFCLNKPECLHSSILIVGNNFGCGSSREHAVWGLRDFGIRIVIGESFADIFYSNCINNGILPIKLKPVLLREIERAFEKPSEIKLTVDLIEQRIILPNGFCIAFQISESDRSKLILGQDQISNTLEREEKIARFEKHHQEKFPWLFQPVI